VALVELDIEFNIWSPIAMIRINRHNAPRLSITSSSQTLSGRHA
jgi:hypothetical protein